MIARPGHLRLTLAPGEARGHVPCLADCLLAAARPAGRLDGGGQLDHALGGSGRFRARGVFHARASRGRIGQQAVGFRPDEEELGLSRTYLIELADPAQVQRAVERLRDRREVESVTPELLTLTGWDVLSHDTISGDSMGRTAMTRAAMTRAAMTSAAMTRAAMNRETDRPLVAGSPTAAQALAPHLMVGAPAALAAEPGLSGLAVAVVDSGVALAHPELAGRLLAGPDLVDLDMGTLIGGLELLGDIAERDFVPLDDVGHGTHVSGVIGAAGRRVPPGLAGACRVLPVRVLAAARSGGGGRTFGVGSVSTISAGIKAAVDAGASVVNLSLGTSAADLPEGSPYPHADVCAYAEHRGVVLVAASGNDGTTVPFLPACLPTVLAVGSVGLSGYTSSFTSTGPHVVLHAPGEGIVGLGLNGYRRSSGTSHAAPFVSATAALVLAAASRRGSGLTPASLRSLLIRTARPRAPGGPLVLDAAAAVAAAQDQSTTPPTRERSTTWHP